MLFVYELEP